MIKPIRGFCLFSVLIVACCLVSCKNADHDKPKDQIVQGTTYPYYNVIKPPDDGWTIEGLLDVTYLYGKPLTTPFNLKSLGKEVEGRDKEPNIAGRIMISIFHDDELIASAVYDKTSEDEVNEDTPFASIQFFRDDKAPESLVINGKRLGSDDSDVADYLGKVVDDNDNKENTVYYMTKDNGFSIETINRDGKFISFVLKQLCDN